MNYSELIENLLQEAIESYSLITGIHEAANLMPMMSQDEFESLVKDVESNGFLRPVKITNDGKVIDGRNRLCVSIHVGKDVRLERFNPTDPIQYVLSENLERRHLSSQQKAAIAVEAETLYQLFAEQAKQAKVEAGESFGRGQEKVSQKIDEPIDNPVKVEPPKPIKPAERRTDTKLAKSFGTNREYVSKAQKVKTYAPELLPGVKSGTVDLNQAGKIASQRKKEVEGAKMEAAKPVLKLEQQVVNLKTGIETVTLDGYKLHIWHDGAAKPTFNTANESIDWAWSTWNPVTGCLHSCPYCYARDIATNDRMKNVYPKGFEPVFHPYRLDAPKNQRVFTDQEIIRKASERKLDLAQARLWAKNVFVCSMADLFGKWVPDSWILQVFESVSKYDQWNYLFLTKYPQRLQEIGEKLGGSFPSNCWVGTTVDEQKRVKIAQDAFANINATVKWLSLEPLLTNLEFSDLGMFDMVAIGGQSQNSQVPEFQPKWGWVENILWQSRKSGTSVYFKENLKCRPKEMPF